MGLGLERKHSRLTLPLDRIQWREIGNQMEGRVMTKPIDKAMAAAREPYIDALNAAATNFDNGLEIFARALDAFAADVARERDSLQMELDAEKHCHLKDNEYLIAQRDEALLAVAEADHAAGKFCHGSSHVTAKGVARMMQWQRDYETIIASAHINDRKD